MDKINFVLVSPSPEYIDYIGGITVVHTLANALRTLGENVYIYANSTNPSYDVECIPWGTNVQFDDENTVLILIAGAGEHTYLHNVPDFFLKAKHIVRWLVNEQVRPYPKENKLYKFHEYWTTIDSQKVDGYLSVIESNHHLFYNKGFDRSGTCYLIKGNLDTESDRIVHTSDDLCIDNVLYGIPNLNRMQFYSDLFNKMEYFISYTPFTHTSVLAAMCGCKSIVIPKSEYGGVSFNKEKWLNEIWCTKYGIAVGFDDLPRAVSTMDQVLPNIKYYEEVTQPTQVKTFVQDCYSWLHL